MPDQFEALFAELRAETVPKILPPGVEATHRTVRKRRRNRRIAVAAVLLTVAGGVAAVNVPRHGGSPEISAAARIDKLVQPARAAITQTDGLTRAGLVAAAGTTEFPEIVIGNYQLIAACSGPGTMTVGATLNGDTDLGGFVVTCAGTPQPSSIDLKVADKGTVTVTLKGDRQATGNAGYALNLHGNTDAESNVPASDATIWNAGRAKALWATSRYAQGDPPISMTTERQTQTARWKGGGGGYEIRVACVGPGSVGLTVVQVHDGDIVPVTEQNIWCIDVDPVGFPQAIQVKVISGADLQLTITPDKDAFNSAGFAFLVNGTG